MPQTPTPEMRLPEVDELPEVPNGPDMAPEKLNMPLPVDITEDAPKIEPQQQINNGGED